MPNLYLDATILEPNRREALFEGSLFVYSSGKAFTALAEFARDCIDEAFAPLNPRSAQHEMEVDRFVAIVGPLKSRFTNNSRTKDLMRGLLAETGHDLETTLFDAPRLRVVSARGYLTAGVGYAYKAHRDTWYAGPQCQINWWASLYDLEPAQSLVFYPEFFTRPVPNSSKQFDYDNWCRTGRTAAIANVKSDTRNHPLPLGTLTERDELRIVMRSDASVSFSAAQLHATAPNTTLSTRFSIDFRTINIHDLTSQRGAANVDSQATGTTAVDFMRASDFAPFDRVALETSIA